MQEMIEINRVRQDDNDLHKRWLTSATADLYIWTKAGLLQAFEYCFDKEQTEKAIRWHRDYAPSFTQIDNGDNPGGYKMSPLVRTGKKPNLVRVSLEFRRNAGRLERSMRRAIYKRIRAQRKA